MAFQFCSDLRSQALRLYDLRRLSVILQVDEGAGVDVSAVEALVSWIKAITVCRELEEFHLSLRLDNEYDAGGEDSDDETDEEEGGISWYGLLEEIIMPFLLDLEVYFTSGARFAQAPHVKISMKDGMEADLSYVRSSFSQLFRTGLDVTRKGMTQVLHFLADSPFDDSICRQGSTWVAQGS